MEWMFASFLYHNLWVCSLIFLPFWGLYTCFLPFLILYITLWIGLFDTFCYNVRARVLRYKSKWEKKELIYRDASVKMRFENCDELTHVFVYARLKEWNSADWYEAKTKINIKLHVNKTIFLFKRRLWIRFGRRIEEFYVFFALLNLYVNASVHI